MRALYALVLLPLLGLTACPGSTPSSALTEAQIAAFAVQTGYTVAAHAEVAVAQTMTTDQVGKMKAADQAAYVCQKSLAAEAQAGNVVAADLSDCQAALAALNAILPASK